MALLPTWDGKTRDSRGEDLDRALRPGRRRGWCMAGESILNAGRCQERDGEGGDGSSKSRWKERPNPHLQLRIEYSDCHARHRRSTCALSLLVAESQPGLTASPSAPPSLLGSVPQSRLRSSPSLPRPASSSLHLQVDRLGESQGADTSPLDYFDHGFVLSVHYVRAWLPSAYCDSFLQAAVDQICDYVRSFSPNPVCPN